MKKHKKGYELGFIIFTLCTLIFNIIVILIFTKANVENNFYNALSVASLSISFASFAASCFFSLSVYLQSINQAKINESIPKKDDQYIINNYSLFNIDKEVSIFSVIDSTDKKLNRFVFLPTESVNSPTYKVFYKNISLINKKGDCLFNKNNDSLIDCKYASNVLQRNYNCIYLDVDTDTDTIANYLTQTKTIILELSIVSIFNVKFDLVFKIELDKYKDTESNTDKKDIKDLRTFLIHHTNYVIKGKSIANLD